MSESLLGLLGNNSSLLDLHLLHVLSQAALDGADDVGLVGSEGEEVSSTSDLELGDACALLDEDGCISKAVLFLAGFLDLSADLPSLRRLRNSLAFLTSLG